MANHIGANINNHIDEMLEDIFEAPQTIDDDCLVELTRSFVPMIVLV